MLFPSLNIPVTLFCRQLFPEEVKFGDRQAGPLFQVERIIVIKTFIMGDFA